MVHRALVGAVGELEDVAHEADGGRDVLAVIELEALDAEIGVALHEAAPERERRRVREVDRLTPVVERDAGPRREEVTAVRLRAQRLRAGLDVGRAPQREAHPRGVCAIDERARVGIARGIEVERVHERGVRMIEPDSRGREIETPDGGEVLEDLLLVAVLVTPDPRTERPRRRHARLARSAVAALHEIDRRVGAEEPHAERLGRAGGAVARPHRERELDGRGILARDVERARALALGEDRPAVRAEQERHGHVRFVRRALELEIGLDLHGPQLAAMIDRVLPFAESVEALAGIARRVRDDAEHRHVRRAAAGSERREVDREAGIAFVVEGEMSAEAVAVVEIDGGARRVTGDDAGVEGARGAERHARLPFPAVHREGVIALGLVERLDDADLEGVDAEHEQRLGGAREHDTPPAGFDVHVIARRPEPDRRSIEDGAVTAGDRRGRERGAQDQQRRVRLHGLPSAPAKRRKLRSVLAPSGASVARARSQAGSPPSPAISSERASM